MVAAVVPNSPAAEASIQRGDLIQKFDGHEVRNILELRRLVSQVELDKKVEVQVTRNGKPVTLSATIKEQPAGLRSGARCSRISPARLRRLRLTNQRMIRTRPTTSGNGILGSIEVQELTPQLANKLGVPPSVRGVVIARVGAEISGAQLRAGDVIEAINQNPVTSVQDYQEAVQSLDPTASRRCFRFAVSAVDLCGCKAALRIA